MKSNIEKQPIYLSKKNPQRGVIYKNNLEHQAVFMV